MAESNQHKTQGGSIVENPGQEGRCVSPPLHARFCCIMWHARWRSNFCCAEHALHEQVARRRRTRRKRCVVIDRACVLICAPCVVLTVDGAQEIDAAGQARFMERALAESARLQREV